jgi:hypothetical protein
MTLNKDVLSMEDLPVELLGKNCKPIWIQSKLFAIRALRLLESSAARREIFEASYGGVINPLCP